MNSLTCLWAVGSILFTLYPQNLEIGTEQTWSKCPLIEFMKEWHFTHNWDMALNQAWIYLHAEAEDEEEEMVLRVVWNFSDSKEELMHLNCGIGADSWESLGLQGDQTSQS